MAGGRRFELEDERANKLHRLAQDDVTEVRRDRQEFLLGWRIFCGLFNLHCLYKD